VQLTLSGRDDAKASFPASEASEASVGNLLDYMCVIGQIPDAAFGGWE
jgi:hypothetical protein